MLPMRGPTYSTTSGQSVGVTWAGRRAQLGAVVPQASGHGFSCIQKG